MRKKGFAPILILFLLVIVGIIVVYFSKNLRNRPNNGPTTTKPLGYPAKPPENNLTTYKGFWMPCSFIDDTCQPMNNTKLLKSMGVNIIGIAPNIKINSKGEISSFPLDFIESRLNDITKAYYAEGIRVFISPELDFTEDLNSRGSGEPKPLPKDIAQKQGFLDKYNILIVELAKLSEKYHLEIFSPMNEPDMKLGTSISSTWAQNILPELRKNYKGKIMWKLGAPIDSSAVNINYRGYDILGVDFTAPGGDENQSISSFPNIASKIITDALAWAKRDGIKKVILSEVGVWGGAGRFSSQGKAAIHKIIFEQGEGKVGGFIFLDPPPDQGWSIKNSASADEVKDWFTRKIN